MFEREIHFCEKSKHYTEILESDPDLNSTPTTYWLCDLKQIFNFFVLSFLICTDRMIYLAVCRADHREQREGMVLAGSQAYRVTSHV